MSSLHSRPAMSMGEAARLFADGPPAPSCENCLSVRITKKAFAHTTRQRKSLTGRHLVLGEFSPARRQLERVKNRANVALLNNRHLLATTPGGYAWRCPPY